MGLLNWMKGPDIHKGLEEYARTPNAWLLDVRTSGEYRTGHIPHSTSLPLQSLEQVTAMIPDRGTPIYLYCQSGARSGRGEKRLRELGYRSVKNLGGLSAYKGPVEA